MRKIALWHFWFVSGLDTAFLALPPFLGRLRDLPAMVSEGARLGTQSYLPSRVSWAVFALGQVYCQICKASDSPFLPLLAWCAALRNYFFPVLFILSKLLDWLCSSPTPCSSTLPYVPRDVGGDVSFHSGLVSTPFFLSYPCVWAVGRL